MQLGENHHTLNWKNRMAGSLKGKKLSDVKLPENTKWYGKETKELEARHQQLIWDIGQRKFTAMVCDAEILQLGQELLDLKNELAARDKAAQEKAQEAAKAPLLKVVEPEVVA